MTLVLLGGDEQTPTSYPTPRFFADSLDFRPAPRIKVIQSSDGHSSGSRIVLVNVATFVLRPRIVLPIVKTNLPDPGGGPVTAAVAVDVTVGKLARCVVVELDVGR